MSLGEYLGAGSGTTKGLYHLNGSSADYSGNGNNGTDTNITYSLANGKFGQGAGFNGSSSKITIANSDYGIGSNFTFAGWIKTSTNAEQAIFCRDVVGTLRAWQIRVDTTTGYLTFIRFNSGGGLIESVSTNVAVNTGAFVHIVVTFNTTDGTRLYVNGVLRGTSSNTTALNNNTGLTPTFGVGAGGATTSYFTGQMDECIFEASYWSAEKVKKYYTYAKGRFNQ